jgi:hypothetical protein
VSSVCVHVVLFNNQIAAVWRLLSAVGATARHARDRHGLDGVRLAFGDSSSTPVLSAQDAAQLDVHGRAAGLDAVTYDFFDANLGSSGGNNRLGATGDEDLVLVLNPDTYPAPTMLSELLAVAADDRVGIAEARQLPLEHPKCYDLRRGDTGWASGCCMLLRRSLFRRLSGFDSEHFFLYCDDVDLSWRVRLAGLRVVHVPTAVVFHDKRIGDDAALLPTEAEHFYALLGRLMLARKYDRADVLAETVAAVTAGGTAAQREALEEYRRREADGRVPDPLAGADRVAEFVGGEYAVHRF